MFAQWTASIPARLTIETAVRISSLSILTPALTAACVWTSVQSKPFFPKRIFPMSGRSMWAKTPTGSKTAVDHLILLVQIRSTRVAAPTMVLVIFARKSFPNEWKCHVEKNSDWFKKAC